ncbi:MAG TPA: succinate--CoA ligase subunit alpha [Phototrophicaceae bacterium]|nr:succinate--CoA ligase subunit alpha [Phototrophicaceae bacterium]
MSILADKNTLLIVQGITGREGSFHTAQMLAYGTQIVGGVTPGKGGEWVYGKPVFDSVSAAVEATGANATIIYVGAANAADAIYEAIDAQIPLIVCVTEGIPVMDMLKVYAYLRQNRASRLIGPNCPGILTPGQSKVGLIPNFIARSGSVGVVARSGTLSYGVVDAMSQAGIGQSTIVGIGGDPIIGTSFVDILEMFEDDPETNRVVLIGEIGGRSEIDAANFIQSRMTKPVFACVVGTSAPERTRIGHAGAVIIEPETTAAAKIDALRAAGAIVVDTPDELVDLLS